MRGAVVVIALAACGRIGFDAHLEDGDVPIARPCGGSTTAPDPVTIQGITYRYTTFGNSRTRISGVTVTARDDEGDITATKPGFTFVDQDVTIPVE